MAESHCNVVSLMASGCVAAVIAGTVVADSGLQDLIDRVGEGNQPTGAGVVVGQVEAQPTNNDNYVADENDPDVSQEGRQWILESGPSGPLGHATDVGGRFYGMQGLAQGVMTIHGWAVNNWLFEGSLRMTEVGIEPDTVPDGLKVINHSWVGSFTTDAQSNEALRRADFQAARDDVLMVAGASVPSIEGFPDMLGPMFNGIMVGMTSGEHTTGDISDGLDGEGRMTPDIVADGSSTSYSTPIVSGAAAILVEAARAEGARREANPNAERAEVIKAALMAGARRDAAWTNNPADAGLDRGVTARPLDEVFGAGELDVNIAHLILTAGEQDGAASEPVSDNIAHEGWDLVTLTPSSNRFYRFSIDSAATEVSILVAWNRWVDSTMAFWELPDFNLELFQVDGDENLIPLTGNFGLGVFDSGNVVSDSKVDNVELLHVRDLEPGEYVIQLSRDDLLPTPFFTDAAIAWCIPDPPCLGDVNDDSSVDLTDLLEVIGNWGSDGSGGGDVNNDDSVDLTDLLEVIGNWGSSCM